MKKIRFILLSAIFISHATLAGFNGYTNHSRANCVNNESISWDWTRDWLLITRSEHYNVNTGEFIHALQTPAEWTWRSAAVHWGEGHGGWKVKGLHWRHYTDRTYHLENEEWVYDCSIYDGWWDKNK